MSETGDPIPNVSPRVHLAFLDGLRALAALFVVVHHSFKTVWSDSLPADAIIPNSVYLYGHFSVTVFIVISGFCLMLPVVRNSGELKGGAKTFYLRRVHRIVPPYYFALGLSLFLCLTLLKQPMGTHWDHSLPVTPLSVLTHLLLVHDIWGSYAINYPLWSIAVEFQIYFFFPLLILWWQRQGGWLITAVWLFLSYACAFALHHTRFNGLTLHYYGIFVLGMMGAQIAFGKDQREEIWRTRVPWLWISVVLLLFAGYICGRSQNAPLLALDFPIGLVGMCLLIGCSRTGTSPVRDFLGSRPLAWIGAFSYSIYLIHAPVIQLIWQYGVHPMHLSDQATFGLLAGPGLLLILGVSYLFFWFCERPFMPGHPHTVRKAEQAAVISSAP